ncbi:MAG: hypothetical protein ABSH20_10115, partial [Tepidisphaeraceae bacterium]
MKPRAWMFVLLLLTAGAAGPGDRLPRRPKAAPVRSVDLPYTIGDAYGVQWDIQADGTIGNGGNGQFNTAGTLQIDNRFTYGPQVPKADFDAARGEVLLPVQTYRGVRISRRVAVSNKAGFCRWAEVLENPTTGRVSLDVSIQYNLGNGVERSQWLEDEKHNEQPIALAAGGEENGYMFFAGGMGTRVLPRMTAPEEGQSVTVHWTVDVPPKQTVVLMHAAGFRRNFGDAVQSLRQIREADLLGTLPAEMQRRVVNYRLNRPEIAGVELLRGELWDTVELRSGDQLVGTVDPAAFVIKTAFGPVEIKSADLAGIVAAPGIRPRHLLVCNDGQAIGGEVQAENFRLRLTDGQLVEFPFAQISRVGWRKRGGEEQEWKLDRPMVMLRTGDRLWIDRPDAAVEVSTRYGRLKLPGVALGSITFLNDDDAAVFHEVRLADGTHLAGLVERASFDLKFAGALAGKAAAVDVASIARLQFGPAAEEPDAAQAALSLANGDVIGGVLTGKLSLDAGFMSLTIECGQIKRLAYQKGTASDVAVTLWDDSTMQGQLGEAMLACEMAGGVGLRVPVSLLTEYNQPRPALPDAAAAEARRLVQELGDADGKRADAAQEKLAAFGGGAIAIAKESQAQAEEPAKKRIGDLLARLESSAKR